MTTKFSQIENIDLYGVEVVGKTAYTCYLGDTSVYHAKYRANDFVDSRIKCIEFMSLKGITEVYGVLSEDVK